MKILFLLSLRVHWTMKIQVHFSNMMKTVVIHLKNKLNTVISERNIFTPPPMNRNQLLELGSKSPSNIWDINLPSHEKQRRNINTIRKKMQNPKYKNEVSYWYLTAIIHPCQIIEFHSQGRAKKEVPRFV